MDAGRDPRQEARALVDLDPGRPGWAVVTLVGAFDSPSALRTVSATLLRLYAADINMISIDASGCGELSRHVGQVLIDASAHARGSGGCLVVTRLTLGCRWRLAHQDKADVVDLVPRPTT